MYHFDDLIKAVENADYVVSCLPMTPETNNLLNKNVF